ncbi:MAG: 3-hydroxyacyl-CoA dehydrogenase family protein [Gemmatimonadales bacterium]
MSEMVRIIRRHEVMGREAPTDVPAPRVERIAVIGAGVMGAGIAQVFASAGYQVRLNDLSDAVLDRAMRRIEEGHFGLRRGVEKGKLSVEQADTARRAITTTTDLALTCRDADLVLEAVPEDLGLKVALFARLAELTRPDCILASNTSGYPIIALAGASGRPAQVIGWHWASPAPVMALAEIVVHGGTAPAVRDAVVEIARRCGRHPQVVRDQPLAWGFVANRILAAVFREAEQIVAEEVATREQVDALVKDCFRWPVGPFEMADATRKGWE